MKKTLLLSILFFAGVFTHWVWDNYLEQTDPELVYKNSINVRDDGYFFTSPLLLCGVAENLESTAFESLKTEVEDVLDAEMSEDDTVSVYFRELESGRWFSINGEEKFSPASLLKLPIYIAYLKMAENESSILEQTINISGDDQNDKENFKSENPILVGQTYTIRELLDAMIKESDNNALYALYQLMNNDLKMEIFTDLGVPLPTQSATEDFMSAKVFSNFFRVLYNGTYLSHNDSENALKTLAENPLENGIVAGLPTGIEFASKFGERKIPDPLTQESKYELHDCGIVYVEDPYLLCVMTKSTQGFEHLSALIQSVSKTIHAQQ